MISLVLICISIVIYLKLNRFYQFTILSLSAFLPFTFGDLRSIPNLLFIEWITVVTFLMLLHDLAPAYFIDKKINEITLKGSGIFLIAISILLLWTIISLFNNEIFHKEALYVRYDIGTKRIYFNIFNNILLFFTVFLFLRSYYDQINFERYFDLLLKIAISLGFIRLISYFIGIEIPFLSGLFSYGGEFGQTSKIKYGGTAFRLGGLTEIVIISTASLFSLSIIRNKINFFVLLLIIGFVFISGGRTVTIGVVFSILFFAFLFYPKNFIYFSVAGVLFTMLALFLVPETVLQGQIGRLTHFRETSFLGQDESRGLAWKLYIDNFINHPIFGKGISVYLDYLYIPDIDRRAFALAQQVSGGHGSYFSILSTFGVGGFVYFILFIFGGICTAFKNIKININSNLVATAISSFCFMILLMKSIDFITSGNGLSLPLLFFVGGIIAAYNKK